jgi:hypothetical protein
MMAAMQCTLCGGALELTGGGADGRCFQCGNLFVVNGGELTPMVVVAPGETSEEAHARVFSAARSPMQRAPQSSLGLWIRIGVTLLVLGIFAGVGLFIWKTVAEETSTKSPTRSV